MDVGRAKESVLYKAPSLPSQSKEKQRKSWRSIDFGSMFEDDGGRTRILIDSRYCLERCQLVVRR